MISSSNLLAIQQEPRSETTKKRDPFLKPDPHADSDSGAWEISSLLKIRLIKPLFVTGSGTKFGSDKEIAAYQFGHPPYFSVPGLG
jgi:hypothetical protein